MACSQVYKESNFKRDHIDGEWMIPPSIATAGGTYTTPTHPCLALTNRFSPSLITVMLPAPPVIYLTQVCPNIKPQTLLRPLTLLSVQQQNRHYPVVCL